MEIPMEITQPNSCFNPLINHQFFHTKKPKITIFATFSWVCLVGDSLFSQWKIHHDWGIIYSEDFLFFWGPRIRKSSFFGWWNPHFSPSFGLLTSLALRPRRRVRQQRHGARIRRGEGRQVETRLSWQKIGLKMVIYWWFREIYWWFREIYLWFSEIYWWFREIYWWFSEIWWWFHGDFMVGHWRWLGFQGELMVSFYRI